MISSSQAFNSLPLLELALGNPKEQWETMTGIKMEEIMNQRIITTTILADFIVCQEVSLKSLKNTVLDLLGLTSVKKTEEIKLILQVDCGFLRVP